MSVVRTYCGHGIGEFFHCAPNVPHYAKNKAKGTMKVGEIFTIGGLMGWALDRTQAMHELSGHTFGACHQPKHGCPLRPSTSEPGVAAAASCPMPAFPCTMLQSP